MIRHHCIRGRQIQNSRIQTCLRPMPIPTPSSAGTPIPSIPYACAPSATSCLSSSSHFRPQEPPSRRRMILPTHDDRLGRAIPLRRLHVPPEVRLALRIRVWHAVAQARLDGGRVLRAGRLHGRRGVLGGGGGVLRLRVVLVRLSGLIIRIRLGLRV